MIEIKTIPVMMPIKMGSVNCYLLENDANYVLIDTGSSNQRSELEKELENAGCKPGQLKQIVITHGDFDHTGNAAYLRDKYSVEIAMHPGDVKMAEYGDMFSNRKNRTYLFERSLRYSSVLGKVKDSDQTYWLKMGMICQSME